MVAAASGRRNTGFHHPGPFPVRQVVTAVQTSDLPQNARIIIDTMLCHADRETSVIGPEVGLSTSHIARYSGLGRATVFRMLNLLEGAGWMRRNSPSRTQQGRQETSGYQFLIPDSGPPGPSLNPRLKDGQDPVSAGSPCPDQAELFTVVPPSEVLPGSTDVPPTAGTSVDQDHKNNSSRSEGKDLTSATDKRAGVSGRNAGSLVAAYIDSYEKTWGMKPQIVSNIKRVGQAAKSLLAQGIEYDTLLDAAKELGTTDHANLTSVASRLVTRRENDPRYHSWQNVRTIAPYPVSSDPEAACGTGPVDAVGTWGRETAVAPRWDDAGPSNWDKAEPWHAEDHYDDYDGDSFENDDEIREAYL